MLVVFREEQINNKSNALFTIDSNKQQTNKHYNKKSPTTNFHHCLFALALALLTTSWSGAEGRRLGEHQHALGSSDVATRKDQDQLATTTPDIFVPTTTTFAHRTDETPTTAYPSMLPSTTFSIISPTTEEPPSSSSATPTTLPSVLPSATTTFQSISPTVQPGNNNIWSIEIENEQQYPEKEVNLTSSSEASVSSQEQISLWALGMKYLALGMILFVIWLVWRRCYPSCTFAADHCFR